MPVLSFQPWGDKDQSLNDYANRTWGGLVSGYYAPRWEMFIDEVIRSVSNKQPFNADAFHQRVTQFEIDWVKSHERYPSEPVGNAVEIATLLMNKYKDSILKKKNTMRIISYISSIIITFLHWLL